MNRVQADPRLTGLTGRAYELRLQDLLRDHASSINQGADGRLFTIRTLTGTGSSAVNELFVIVKPSGTMTLTIPSARDMLGKLLIVKRGNNTTHTVTVQSSSGTIDGAASVTLTTAWQRRMLMSDGTEFFEVT